MARKKDSWDKINIIFSLCFMGITAFATVVIAMYSIPQATEAIKSNLRSCGTPYPIAVKVTYNDLPVIADIELNNKDIGETKKGKTNEFGEYIEETSNLGWPGGSRIKVKACYATIPCQTKEVIMSCSRGADDIIFQL